MAHDDERRTEEGFRRLIAFTDAVVAIALTVLVLPLADVVTRLHENIGVWELFRENRSAIGSFVLSFAVIWVMWHHHHQILEYFRMYDTTLFTLMFVWLLTIVTLPFATALIDTSYVQRGNVVYIGVLLISMLALVITSWWGMRHRHLLGDGPDVERWIARGLSLGNPITALVAFVVALVVPAASEWPLLLLFLASPIDAGLRRMRR